MLPPIPLPENLVRRCALDFRPSLKGRVESKGIPQCQSIPNTISIYS